VVNHHISVSNCSVTTNKPSNNVGGGYTFLLTLIRKWNNASLISLFVLLDRDLSRVDDNNRYSDNFGRSL